MADADDYESLPETAPLSVVATAGAVAGVAEHCAMYPVDSVKVIFIFEINPMSCVSRRKVADFWL